MVDRLAEWAKREQPIRLKRKGFLYRTGYCQIMSWRETGFNKVTGGEIAFVYLADVIAIAIFAGCLFGIFNLPKMGNIALAILAIFPGPFVIEVLLIGILGITIAWAAQIADIFLGTKFLEIFSDLPDKYPIILED